MNAFILTVDEQDILDMCQGQTVEIHADNKEYVTSSTQLFEMYALTGRPIITLRYVRKKL